MDPISHTDLILNPDGSIYHLHLVPDEIAETVILVGDPGRVQQVSAHFDRVDTEKSNREFVTCTGVYHGKRITALSTGIGTDNIDIVLNELDALVNVDLASRTLKPDQKRLSLIRIGTSGAIHADIAPGATIVTSVAGGFDGLYHFYRDDAKVTVPGLAKSFMGFAGWTSPRADPYFIRGSERLGSLLSGEGQVTGITISTPGFYGPQVRSIRLTAVDPLMIQKLGSFTFEGMRINNFEMESSALYALSALLGHDAITLCVAIANRASREFLDNYTPAVDDLIGMVLDKITLHDD